MFLVWSVVPFGTSVNEEKNQYFVYKETFTAHLFR